MIYVIVTLIASLFTSSGLAGGIDCILSSQPFNPVGESIEFCAGEYSDEIPLIGEQVQFALFDENTQAWLSGYAKHGQVDDILSYLFTGATGTVFTLTLKRRQGLSTLTYRHDNPDALYQWVSADFPVPPIKAEDWGVLVHKAYHTGRAYLGQRIELEARQ